MFWTFTAIEKVISVNIACFAVFDWSKDHLIHLKAIKLTDEILINAQFTVYSQFIEWTTYSSESFHVKVEYNGIKHHTKKVKTQCLYNVNPKRNMQTIVTPKYMWGPCGPKDIMAWHGFSDYDNNSSSTCLRRPRIFLLGHSVSFFLIWGKSVSRPAPIWLVW